MKRDRLLEESNREHEERSWLPLGSTVMPAARERTMDLTRTGREGAVDPLGLWRILRGSR